MKLHRCGLPSSHTSTPIVLDASFQMDIQWRLARYPSRQTTPIVSLLGECFVGRPFAGPYHSSPTHACTCDPHSQHSVVKVRGYTRTPSIFIDVLYTPPLAANGESMKTTYFKHFECKRRPHTSIQVLNHECWPLLAYQATCTHAHTRSIVMG